MAKTRAQIQQELKDTARDLRTDGPELLTSGTNYPADLAAYQLIQQAIGDKLTDAQKATMFDQMSNSPAAITMFDKTQTDNPITKASRANAVLPAMADLYKNNPAGFSRLLKFSANDPRMDTIVTDINNGGAFDAAALNRLAAAPTAQRAAAAPAPVATPVAQPAAPAVKREAAAPARNTDAADLAQPVRAAAPATPAVVSTAAAPVDAVAAMGRSDGPLGMADGATLTAAQAKSLTSAAQSEMGRLQADITNTLGADAANAFMATVKPDELAFMMQDSRYGSERAAFLNGLNKPGAAEDMIKRPEAYLSALNSGDAANALGSRYSTGIMTMNMLPKPEELTGPYAEQLRMGFANIQITEEGRASWLYAAQQGSGVHPDSTTNETVFERNLYSMQKMMAADAPPPAGMTEAQMKIVMNDFAETPSKYIELLGRPDFDAALKRVATAEIAGNQMGWNFDGVGPYFSGMMAQMGDMFKDMFGGFKSMFGDLLGGSGLNLDGVTAGKHAPEGVEAQANALNTNPMGTAADALERQRQQQAAMGMQSGPNAAPHRAPELDPMLVPTG